MGRRPRGGARSRSSARSSGGELFRRYGDAFPAAYRADWVARSAVADIVHVEELPEADGLGISLYRPLEAGPRMLRAKLFRAGRPLMLSDVLPLFENMGVRGRRRAPLPDRPARPRRRLDLRLRPRPTPAAATSTTGGIRERFQDAFVRAWRGDAENDGYNRLVLGAALTWREITVLRAIGKYLRQARITFSDPYVEQALVAHPEIARLLVALFQARFDPRRTDRADAGEIAERIGEAIDAVESLDQDRILRMFLAVIQAMLRTNYFQTGPTEAASHLSFKLDPTALRWLPLPRPRFEIFVYSPRTEGVHLRGGWVARGGIRWSDRREDFRTEILGLMKAQMVKNAVIVPVGAKGGFVVKRAAGTPRGPARGGRGLLPDLHQRPARPHRQHRRRRGRPPPRTSCATTATTRTWSSPPTRARRRSPTSPTASPSSTASGSATRSPPAARSATTTRRWASPRAARGSPSSATSASSGNDVQEEDFTVVGIGDMSGDVFGNGMLLSRHIRLVAAFDHRHVFLDPDPDPERELRGAGAAVRAAALVAGTTTTAT